MSTPALGQRPAVAPLVAALTAAVLTVLGVLAWQAFDRVPCEGFGCLGPALIAVVTIPTTATLLGWLLLRAFGVPRAFLVAALTVASASLLGGTVSLPQQLEVGYWAVPALCAAAWTWALTPGHARRGLALAGGLAAVGLAGYLWQQWSFERDAEARLDATQAPQLILDDERWELSAPMSRLTRSAPCTRPATAYACPSPPPRHQPTPIPRTARRSLRPCWTSRARPVPTSAPGCGR